MANVINESILKPTYYVFEGLGHLHGALGMARRAFWGYGSERETLGKNIGDVVNITVPSLLTASTDPNSGTQDLQTSSRTIRLDTYVHTSFQVTDQDLVAGGTRIIDMHIGEAMNAVARELDSALFDLCASIPYRIAIDNTDVMKDMINGRQALTANGLQSNSRVGNPFHFAVDPIEAGRLYASPMYSSAGTAGSDASNTLLYGEFGNRFGITPFESQNAAVSHTCGTIATQATEETAALVGNHTVGATTLSLDGATAARTIKVNDSFGIAGSNQKYVATTDATVSGGGTVAIGCYPGLVKSYPDNAVVTFDKSPIAGGVYKGLAMFDSQAFAVVPAQLSMIGRELNVPMQTKTDPETGLSIRATVQYMAENGGAGRVVVRYDALFGVALVDPNRAVLLCRPVS